ncbi:MAG: hypothetical protein WBF77_00380, partial [Sulfurimonadaceae bacterium]
FYDVAFHDSQFSCSHALSFSSLSATLHYALAFYLLASSRNAFDDVSHNVSGSSPKKAKQFAFS